MRRERWTGAAGLTLVGALALTGSLPGMATAASKRTARPSASKSAELAWLHGIALPIYKKMTSAENTFLYYSGDMSGPEVVVSGKYKGYTQYEAAISTAFTESSRVDDGKSIINNNATIFSYWVSMVKATSGFLGACNNPESEGGFSKSASKCWNKMGSWGQADFKWQRAVNRLTGKKIFNPDASPSTTTSSTVPPTTTSTTSPAQAQAAYEASCTNQMPYVQLIKDPDELKGQCITEQGQVFQYDTATGLTDMLVAIDNDGYGDWSDNVEVKLPDASAGNGIYEHDVVQFWGPISGSDTYTDTSGGSQTVPVVKARYITLISSAGG